MNILIVNDDSIYAPGIIALANALKNEHKITIVAPERQMSGTSHSITFYGFLNYDKLDLIDGVDCYILKGTPSDCTKFGIEVILNGVRPDVVISGINKGYNVGTDILYSGTVNAALEGSVFKIKSIAVSQSYHMNSFEYSANFIKNNLNRLLDMIPQDDHVAISVNIPTDDPMYLKGVKIASVGTNRYDDKYVYVKNQGYYITGNPLADIDNEDHSDVELINQNYITVSFVRNEFNDYKLFEKFKDIQL